LMLGIINPRPPLSVTVNVARRVNRIHGFLSSLAPAYSNLGRKTTHFIVAPPGGFTTKITKFTKSRKERG
jgi:hypothetical protein